PHRPLEIVIPHISHVLRLQLLSAKLSANMQRAFSGSYFFVPGTQVQQRPLVLSKRSPHQPPAIGRSLQETAIRSGTAVKRTTAWGLGVRSWHRALTSPGRMVQKGATILANLR